MAVCGLNRNASAEVTFWSNLAERSDVIENPEAAAMSGGHKIVILDNYVTDGACGHVEPQ